MEIEEIIEEDRDKEGEVVPARRSSKNSSSRRRSRNRWLDTIYLCGMHYNSIDSKFYNKMKNNYFPSPHALYPSSHPESPSTALAHAKNPGGSTSTRVRSLSRPGCPILPRGRRRPSTNRIWYSKFGRRRREISWRGLLLFSFSEPYLNPRNWWGRGRRKGGNKTSLGSRPTLSKDRFSTS